MEIETVILTVDRLVPSAKFSEEPARIAKEEPFNWEHTAVRTSDPFFKVESFVLSGTSTTFALLR